MPNPLAALSPTGLVSDDRATLNANFAARHALGVTALTDADDGYAVLADDEALECTLGADMGVVLPDPATCVGRSVYLLVAAAGGHTLSVTAAGGADVSGGATRTPWSVQDRQ